MTAAASAAGARRRLAHRAPRSIAILRALQLGDLLCLVPALRALRAAAPDARITLLGLPWAETFVRRFRHYLNDFIAMPGIDGLPEQPARAGALPAFVAAARRRRFDLALQLHGSGGITNRILMQLGAARVAGFYPSDETCPDPVGFLPWCEREHEVLRPLRLLAHLGIAPRGEALEFPLTESDFAALEIGCAGLPAPGTYVCVHPGARMPTRRWPIERFAAVADRIARQGLQIVLTGTSGERALVDATRHAMRMPAIDLAGKTSLGALAALIAQARLVVCNDTGISHVAAAVATASVVICSGADPQRWAPLDHARHRTLAHPIACRPCAHAVCPIGHPCAHAITPDMVMAQVRALLEWRDAAPSSHSPCPAIAADRSPSP